jgi:hypothetical protein
MEMVMVMVLHPLLFLLLKVLGLGQLMELVPQQRQQHRLLLSIVLLQMKLLFV